MADPTLHFIRCPDAARGHRMAYWQWGAADAPHVVVCVHGLTRQGRDFDVLAQALVAASSTPLRVVCPDVAGRGQSDWLIDPTNYTVTTYAGDMVHLVASLQATTLDWVGTSLGGLVGMALFGQPALFPNTQLRRLVLNDVGPTLEWSSLQRIGTYVGKQMAFDSVQHAADALWEISRSFGPHTPQQWLALSRPMLRREPNPNGGVRLHYDPAIADTLLSLTPEASAAGEAALWTLYDAIKGPVLLLRGAESDLLSPHTAQQMCTRGPQAQLREFAGIGHAPTLTAPDQVAALTAFLLS